MLCRNTQMEAYKKNRTTLELSHGQDEHARLESSCFMTARAAGTPDRRYTYKEIAVPLYRVEPLYGAVLIQRSTHMAPSTMSL